MERRRSVYVKILTYTLIVSLLTFPSFILSVHATIYFADTFSNLDSWDVTTQDSAVVEILDVGGDHGTVVNMSGVLWNDYSMAYVKTALEYGATTTIHFSVDLKVVDFPTSAITFTFYGAGLSPDNTTAPYAGVQWMRVNQTVTIWDATVDNSYSLAEFSLGSWYQIDVYVNLATEAFKWYVDSSLAYSTTLSGHTADNFDFPFFGWQFADGAVDSGRYEIYVDNFTVDSVAAPVSSLVVTLSSDRTSAPANQPINVSIAITSGGSPVTNYNVNVTRDGVLIRTNLAASSFTESGEGITSVYTVSAAKDLDTGTTSFTTNSLTLKWSDPSSEVVGPSPSEGEPATIPAPPLIQIGGLKIPRIVIPPMGVYGILLSLVLIAVGGILASRKKTRVGPRRPRAGQQYATRKERPREARRTRER